jgi:hypothetical protein
MGLITWEEGIRVGVGLWLMMMAEYGLIKNKLSKTFMLILNNLSRNCEGKAGA